MAVLEVLLNGIDGLCRRLLCLVRHDWKPGWSLRVEHCRRKGCGAFRSAE